MSVVTDELASTILSQILDDPQLPRSQPTESLWQVPIHADVGSIQSETLPKTVDYAVIGSGVTGLGVTKNLLDSPLSGSKSVTVFEARSVCSGATGRNGGQLTRLPPPRHDMMIKNFGLETANKVIRLTLRTLQKMKDLAESEGPEVKSQAAVTKLEKFISFHDEEAWNAIVESMKVYEEQLPEERGQLKLVSKEEVASVSGQSKEARLLFH